MWTIGRLHTRRSPIPEYRAMHGLEVEVLGTTTVNHPSGPFMMADVRLTSTGDLLTLPATYVTSVEARVMKEGGDQ